MRIEIINCSLQNVSSKKKKVYILITNFIFYHLIKSNETQQLSTLKFNTQIQALNKFNQKITQAYH